MAYANCLSSCRGSDTLSNELFDIPQADDAASDFIDGQRPIVVIDGIMGSGKTTYIAREIERAVCEDWRRHWSTIGVSNPRRFIFVTPFLTEAERIRNACPNAQFELPDDGVAPTKSLHLASLINQGRNIATTHALFSKLPEASYEALRTQNYFLIIDEALGCVETYQGLKKDDVKLLLKSGLVSREKDDRLAWTATGDLKETRYSDVREFCLNRSALVLGDNTLIWKQPAATFALFRRVIVLTYFFEGSIMAAYLRSERLPYETLGLERKAAGPKPLGQCSEREAKQVIGSILTIKEDRRLNEVGRRRTASTRERLDGTPRRPLSASWFSKADDSALDALSRNLESFAKSCPGGISAFAWTTLKARRERLQRARFRREDAWIPCNARASNEYRHKSHLAYMVDRYPNPVLAGYFRRSGVAINRDLFALSEMLQWLWRGCIREYDEEKLMTVFIPSERMRGLLKLWLQCDSVEELYRRLDDTGPMKPAKFAA